MSYVVAAIALIVAANGASLAFSSPAAVPEFHDIGLICRLINEAAAECAAGAARAGWVMVVGAALAGAIAWPALRALPTTPVLTTGDGWSARLFLVAVIALLAIHVTFQLDHGPAVSRVDAIERVSHLISAENLAWPLLLQLASTQSKLRSRLLYLTPAFYIASLSPFRGVLFAVTLFGVMLPLAGQLRDRENRRGWRGAITNAIGLAAVCGVLGYLVYAQTASRPGSLPGNGIYEQTLKPRIAAPLFQAYLAERLSAFTPLPDMAQEIRRKLRLTDEPSLNEFLFRRIYGAGYFGETTSLYYGEALANSRSHPLVWTTLAPLLLVWSWAMLRRRGLDAGVLFGLALWRGSLGGFATVLPALVLQLATLLAIHLLQSRASGNRMEQGRQA